MLCLWYSGLSNIFDEIINSNLYYCELCGTSLRPKKARVSTRGFYILIIS